jgi:hypothetical protein
MQSRLAKDVNMVEEEELQRLDGRRPTARGNGGRRASALLQQPEQDALQTVSGVHAQTQEEVPGAGAQLVTGYAEHRASLIEKKTYRRATKIDLKLPEASTALTGVPRRKEFAEGDEGRQLWRAAFNSYAGEFAYSHVGAGTVKNRMGSVGMWGEYCEREGHGEYVKWEHKSSGTLRKVVVPVRDAATGHIIVPDTECIAEYIMVMAIGDTKARPKGGTAK